MIFRFRIQWASFGCGQIFWQHNSAMAMNDVVTPHLPVCLYSAAGGKVNRQVACTHWAVARTRWTVDHSAPGKWINRSFVPAAWWATSRSKYFNRFSATSSGKVFFGPSALRSLGDFFTDQARYEKRSSTAKGLLLGVCFVAEDPVRRNTFGRSSQKQCQSCNPWSFGIATCLKTKEWTDLKMKWPINPW
jgi:hypothetical protein